jgi:hypothetical protein
MFIPTAKEIVVKDIEVTTLSGAPVTVMCNSTAVRSHSSSGCFHTLGSVPFADVAYPAIERIDPDRRGVQVLEWSFRADCGRETSIRNCRRFLEGYPTICGVR